MYIYFVDRKCNMSNARTERERKGEMCIHNQQSCNKDVILFSFLSGSQALSSLHYSAVFLVSYVFISKNTCVIIFKVRLTSQGHRNNCRLTAESSLSVRC
ncbi:hypothetical protein AMECASPLE_030518 [Ameca splendens]|uniref:Uncharacterized protein n=1 Tax=Ameca splendens TaxID=208324 RepID=A0ABV1ADG6_9TELE